MPTTMFKVMLNDIIVICMKEPKINHEIFFKRWVASIGCCIEFSISDLSVLGDLKVTKCILKSKCKFH